MHTRAYKSMSGKLLAVALLASGQASTVTGTMAGQIIMESFLGLKIYPSLRRLITRLFAIVPALVTIFVYGDDKLSNLLILSQVVLSLQLPFAVIPLVYFTCSRRMMGVHINSWILTLLATLATIIVIGMNVAVLVFMILGFEP